MQLNQIYQGDCNELIKKLDDNSVDIVLTSPPYNSMRTSQSDVGYDIYKDNLTNEQYLEMSLKLFEQIDRVLVKNGVVLYNLSYGTDSPNNTSLMWLLVTSIILNTNFCVGDVITWKKRSASPNNTSCNKGTRICEWVIVFCRKNEFKTFKANKKVKSVRATGQVYYENVFNFLEARNNDGQCALNKATFSTELVLQLLDRYSTSTDDVILDPFMGTGTTAKGCIERNRNFIGFELSQAQVDYANERLKNIDVVKMDLDDNWWI